MALLDGTRLSCSGAMLSEIGRVRTSNEDTVVFVTPIEGEPGAEKGALALVADGMGGHAAGEVASALAAEIVRRIYFALDVSAPDALRRAFETANSAILDYSEAHPECRGMGTTCTALAIRDDMAWLAHVGDSRAYLLREGVLTQLSEDQSLHAQMIRDGLMTEKEAETHPGQNYILQALGTRTDVAPAIWNEGLPLYEGDVLLLCSDGLSNLISAVEIAQAASMPDPREACRTLVDMACEAGGYDNISAGVFHIQKLENQTEHLPLETRRISVFRPVETHEMELSSGATRIIKVTAGSL